MRACFFVFLGENCGALPLFSQLNASCKRRRRGSAERFFMLNAGKRAVPPLRSHALLVAVDKKSHFYRKKGVNLPARGEKADKARFPDIRRKIPSDVTRIPRFCGLGTRSSGARRRCTRAHWHCPSVSHSLRVISQIQIMYYNCTNLNST